jgi:hypothetical protein
MRRFPLIANWLPAPGCDLAAAGARAGDYESRFGWLSPDEELVMEWAVDRRAPLAAARSPYALWRGGWLDLRAAAWLGRN